MRFTISNLPVSCALALLTILLAAEPVAAQGSATPTFGDGKLTLVGKDYRPGERVEITVQIGGRSHRFTATADARGRFRLETGLAVPPLSSVRVEARDEQGLTQATTTGAPGDPSGAGAPLPPTPGGGTPPLSAPGTGGSPASTASPDRMPTQLPRTGAAVQGAPIVLPVGLLGLLLGAALRARHRAHRARSTSTAG